jgi:anti-sigma factor RsiW
MNLRTLSSRLRTLFGQQEHLSKDCEEFSAHLAECPECAGLIEAHTEVRLSLAVLREAAPDVSQSLDDAVIANYRAQIRHRDAAVPALPRRGSHLRLALTGSLAAALLVAAVLFWTPRKQSKDPITSFQTDRAAMRQASTPVLPTVTTARVPRRANRIQKVKKPVTTARSERKMHSVDHDSALRGAAIPASFSSLIYCDELSCGGAMDMVRVRLPSPLRMMPSSMTPSGPVYADVLVGADGIARGIRIVH